MDNEKFREAEPVFSTLAIYLNVMTTLIRANIETREIVSSIITGDNHTAAVRLRALIESDDSAEVLTTALGKLQAYLETFK